LLNKITVYIIVYNDVAKIEAAINSVMWADEILVVDSHSTDGTTELAEKLGAKVVHVEFKGFGDLRNKALSHCKYDWIFSLDSDERCTRKLRDEILQIVKTPLDNLKHHIYFVPRKNYFMGKWIKHSGWYPNYRQPQLFRKGSMSYTLDAVHEGYIINKNNLSNSVGYLKQDLWQKPFENLKQLIHKADRYSDLGVKKLESKNTKPGLFKAFYKASWVFIKHYIFKKGLLDGWPGFMIAFGNFEGTFYRYAKFYESSQIKENKWSEPESEPLYRA
jgi:glycosyltransferase involved in cell wall biosynthesis